MKILQKTRCYRDRKFRKEDFENQRISGNSKKRGALNLSGKQLWNSLVLSTTQVENGTCPKSKNPTVNLLFFIQGPYRVSVIAGR